MAIRVSRLKRLTGALVLSFSVLSAAAMADELHFACTLATVDMMGSTPCTDGCRTISLAVDLEKKTVSALNTGDKDGLFPAIIDASAVDWDTELFHYSLDRYTTQMHQRSSPKHGQTMIKIAFHFTCKVVQQQF